MTSIYRYVLIPSMVAASVLPAACGDAKSPVAETKGGPGSGGYEGLVAGDGIVFSEGRCSFSMLYSDFIVERTKGAAPDAEKKSTRGFTLRGPAHIAGAPVDVTLRGAYLGGPGPIAKVTLEYGSEKVSQDFALAEETSSGDIMLTVKAKGTEGANPVSVSVVLATANPVTAERAVHIDSVDLAVDGEFCKSAPPAK